MPGRVRTGPAPRGAMVRTTHRASPTASGRSSSNSTVSCGARDRTAACSPSPARMRWPPKRITKSPALSPALSAADPGSTLRMRAPEMFGSSPTLTPSWARDALPVRSNSPATRFAWLAGMAKPTPIDPPSAPVVAMAELMPISWPRMSTSGPPELPGLIAASVCSAFSTVASLATRAPPTLTGRLIALMMPVVTVPPSPSGEPNATTCCPTRTVSELPSCIGVSPETLRARSTARSKPGSRPTISACAVAPSWNTAVTTPPRAAASTTWLLVSSRPSGLSTTPEPSPPRPAPSTRS